MFGHGQARDIQALVTRCDQLQLVLGDLQTRLAQLERDSADMHADVVRWMRRDRTRSARATAEEQQAPSASVAQGSPVPPPGLRGARLRIWNRRHGISSTEGTGITQVPLNELGNESEEPNGVSP